MQYRRIMIPMSKRSNSSSSPTSPPISLPASHVRRTPSELRLEELSLRAELDDDRMYARLVSGMFDQIRDRYVASGGRVHPLSRKSFRGIIRTMLAKDAEPERRHRKSSDEDDATHDGWDVAHVADGGNESMGSLPSLSRSTPTIGSEGSILSQNHDTEEKEIKQEKDQQDEQIEQDEDVCMFSMEL